MLNGCRVRITGRKNYHVRKPVYKKKVAVKKQSVAQQKKMPEVTVKYNPYDYDNEELFSLVGYLCPHCKEKLWLEYYDGRRNTICPICKKEFILNIERKYK